MIEIGTDKAGGAGFRAPVARLVAVGGAGSNILDRSALDGIDKDIVCSVNTDIQSLSASVAALKVQIGRSVTRGLGAGGDPELGLSAAEESEGDLRELFVGCHLAFLCVGLGGGTGSGAAPLCARLARESGAVVVAFVTMPFEFEGRRRNEQAAEALAAIEEEVDAVVCFENDRMGELAGGRGGIHDAFLRSDQIVSQSIRSVLDFTARPSLMRVGVDELVAVLRGREARCLFGFGEGEGGSAVHDALAAALKSPLMDRGRMLAEAGAVLVQVTGGPGMTYVEMQSLMGELAKHVNPLARVHLGVAIDHACASRIRLTLLSAFGAVGEEAPVQSGRARSPHPSPSQTSHADVRDKDNPGGSRQAAPTIIDVPLPGIDPAGEAAPVNDPVDIPPPVAPHSGAPVQGVTPGDAKPSAPARQARTGAPHPAPADGPQQVAFQFETVSRGRFDKSEPTIIDGEDLDVPAFMRKGIRIR